MAFASGKNASQYLINWKRKKTKSVKLYHMESSSAMFYVPPTNQRTCCCEFTNTCRYFSVCFLKSFAFSFCFDENERSFLECSFLSLLYFIPDRYVQFIKKNHSQTSNRITSFRTVAEILSKSLSYCVTFASHC